VAQRVVIVIALGIVLALIGQWIAGSSDGVTGWVALTIGAVALLAMGSNSGGPRSGITRPTSWGHLPQRIEVRGGLAWLGGP
jgi:hypothetical protein